jgi:tetratricopeptide (TPR) repeat protein
MKHTVQNSERFIGDLAELSLRGLREIRAGNAKVGAGFVTASVINAAISTSRAQLAALIDLGEKAHALRDRQTLRLVGQAIRSLPLGALSDSIGNYYIALSLCRNGRDAYPEANKIFSAVAEKAPKLFSAKAWVALGSNLTISGDPSGGLSAHAEGCKVAEGLGRGALPLLFHVAINRSHLKSSDGDHKAAIEDLRRLAPLAKIVGIERPPLLYIFKNNLATELVETGAAEEAAFLAKDLRKSPFAHLYPEWLRTSDEIASKTQKASRNIVFIGEPFTGAVDESPAVDTTESRDGIPTAEADRVEPESVGSATCSFEPKPLQAAVAAVLLEFRSIITKSTFPSTTTRGIRAPWPARPEHRPPGQGYAQSPPARGPPVT